jgi:hypothetical protein
MESIIELINNLPVQEKTKYGYRNRYKRMVKDGFEVPIGDNEEIDKVKEYIDRIEKNNSKMDLLNMIVVIRKGLGKPITNIDEYRSKMRKETEKKNVEVMNQRKDTLIEYEQFENELESVHKKKEWNKYIINYLWFNYGVRNEDVNVKVVSRMKDMNENENYLLIKADKVIYTRNKYKTYSTYGKNVIDITDRKFRLACKKVSGYLLNQEAELGNDLKKYYILKMTERDIFNIIVDKYYKDKDITKINELSKSRGTALSTMKSFYNVNAVDEVFREV